MGTVFWTAFATVTGTARFGAVSADLVLQAESQSNVTGRAIARTARVKLVFRRIIIGCERYEEFRVSAGASGIQDQVRGQFPGWLSTYFTACDPRSAKILRGKRQTIRFGSTCNFSAHPSNRLDAAQHGRLHENFHPRSSGGGLVEEPEHSSIGGADTAGGVCAEAGV